MRSKSPLFLIQKNKSLKSILLNFNTLPLHFINLLFIIMGRGTVKFFNDSKGFGFITEEESGKEHFVHVSGLIDDIREGDTVEFELTEGRKGLNAVNVKVVQ